jgi:hypothetical protein
MSKMITKKMSRWEEILAECGLDLSYSVGHKLYNLTEEFHCPETQYAPRAEILDMLSKVTEYITNLPPNTEVTVREAIEAVGGDPSLRSTQFAVRKHLLDTNLLVHVPKSKEVFQRIEYTPAPVETETPELLN